ncbi:hypothetical protein JTE90_015892 [Oedothorax gibbosus]|uniref:Capsid protein n=1 Tax=Oedothorax gibbosus TaxID=931172 RepID=A0AAV6VTC0_9ARAC|nr:hypothetical protein JTE90_015892 [Oedothorax gibbosus]
MHNIIPIENTLVSTGGAVTPKVIDQTQPYMETFTDTDMILSIQGIYTNDKLNTNMSINTGIPTKTNLAHVEWEKENIQTDNNIPALQAWNHQHHNLDLMNSWNWNTITPEEALQYKWQSEEVKWRHAMRPASGIAALQTGASYLGRWDGGETAAKPNVSYTKQVLDPYEKPAPTCIIRTMQLYGSNDVLNTVCFMVLITYTSEIYADMNDARFFPLYNGMSF